MSMAAKAAKKAVVKTADEVLGEILPVKEIAGVMDEGLSPMKKAIRNFELKGAFRDNDGDGELNFTDDDAVFSRKTAVKSIWGSIWDWLFGDDSSS